MNKEKLNNISVDLPKIRQIQDIIAKYTFIKVLTPKNLKTEKEKFFNFLKEEKTYNPQFEYNSFPKVNEDIKIMKKIKFENKYVKDIYEDYKKWCLLQLYLVKYAGKDSEKFTKISLELFRTPKLKIIKKAKKYLEEKERFFEKKEIDAKTLKNMFEILISKSDFTKNWGKWHIRLSKELVAAVAVDSKGRVIGVRPDAKFSKQEVYRLFTHEVKVHARRREMGSNRLYKIFPFLITGAPWYIETEEGLAIYLQGKENSGINPLDVYAFRVIAVDLTLKKSLYEIFKIGKEYGFDDEIAWITAIRVKRGIKDTSESGGMTKDHAYYTGLNAVEKYLEKNGTIADLLKYGKVSIEYAEKFKEIEIDLFDN